MTLVEINKIDAGVVAAKSVTIAIVGDVHDQWSGADTQALESLGVDLALFVGDFGNESVSIVQQIAAVSVPKAVILGNHDAWYTASKVNRKKCPYDQTKEDRVQQQLDALGDCHVGFGKLEVPDCKLTVVGARPYSWGGTRWRHGQFYQERCGVSSFAESTAKICDSIDAAKQNTLILLGHNGPAGLGDQMHHICGRDWKRSGGDYGDPDFADAIAHAHHSNRQVPLVVFGHMHHELKHDKTRLRDRVVVDHHDTVYVNGAQVPRVLKTASTWQCSFTLVTLAAGKVQTVRLVWVNATATLVSEEYLY
ncbi:TIGR04168 family protein [Leptothoe spongobia]|uniref:TIGR04168 family protein n=1 Tax=Leptothoe spongobia TAU-MAC 1115 TaxID=1967444 RepID=A0A947GKT8_9CYAN|nr:TIGR04168 family protein [Leptothoe spongobia]MBT9317935.1 TIGR04168 family protein [Leptothoe spongobia TAU-MAC 1115]